MAASDFTAHEFTILDSLLEGCQIIGRDWKYLYLNDSAVEQARQPREALLGKTMWDAYPGIQQTDMFAQLERAMTDQQPVRILNEFTYPDGNIGWFELRAQPVADGILIFSQDVTSRQLAEQQVRVQLKRLQTLRQIDLAITSGVDLSVVSDIVLDHALSGLEVDAGTILLLDPYSLKLKVAAFRGFNGNDITAVVNKLGDGLSGRVALEQKTIVVKDLDTDPRFTRRNLIAREGFKSYFGAPLIAKGQVLGVLELFHRSSIERDLGWLEFFEFVAGQTAIAISHIDTFGSLQRVNLELMLAYDRTIEGWAKTLEVRDIETQGHSQRVTELTDELASALNYDPGELMNMRRGAMLHDIGKLGIPDTILLKPDSLTDVEWNQMRRHPTIAHELLSRIDFLKPALDIPHYHHERWDGTGYPLGLQKDLIPRSARIFAIVDVWDALRSDRPYRPAWTDAKAREHLQAASESHFDPEILDVFLTEVL